jgi:hypothetical protein
MTSICTSDNISLERTLQAEVRRPNSNVRGAQLNR